MKYLCGAGVFIFSLAVGYGVFLQFFDHENQKRMMASLKTDYDLSCLNGAEFEKAVKSRIVNGFKSTRKDGNLGLYVGHFIYADSGTDTSEICKSRDRGISSALQVVAKKLACKEYPRLSLYFAADQEATSGSKRELLVETDCSVSSDLSRTDTVWIPWDQLAQETPFEGDTQYNTPSKVAIKTSHIADQWPEKWVLEGIQLSGSSGQIKVNADEIRAIAGRPLVFEFK